MNYLLFAFLLLATPIAYGANAAATGALATEADLKLGTIILIPAMPVVPGYLYVPSVAPANNNVVYAQVPNIEMEAKSHIANITTPFNLSQYNAKLEELAKIGASAELVLRLDETIGQAEGYLNNLHRAPSEETAQINEKITQKINGYAFAIADSFEYISTSLVNNLRNQGLEVPPGQYQPAIAASQYLNVKLITESLSDYMLTRVIAAAQHRKTGAEKYKWFCSTPSQKDAAQWTIQNYAHLYNTLFNFEKEKRKQTVSRLRLRVKERTTPQAKPAE